MLSKTRTGALAGLIAAVSMTATPATAADLPTATAPAQGSSIYADFDQSRYDSDTEIAQRHRRWRRHRHRVDAGDVLAGVLIIGGIAAIASAANSNKRRERERVYERNNDRDYNRDRDYDRRDTRRSTSNSGLDTAASQCVSRIERDVRVETVDGVNRTAQGWTVTGSLYNGEAFVCQIDENGRISDINYSGYRGSANDEGQTSRARGEDSQWTDADYADARRAKGVQTPSSATENLPAYPGGPLPGEAEVDGDLGG